MLATQKWVRTPLSLGTIALHHCTLHHCTPPLHTNALHTALHHCDGLYTYRITSPWHQADKRRTDSGFPDVHLAERIFYPNGHLAEQIIHLPDIPSLNLKTAKQICRYVTAYATIIYGYYLLLLLFTANILYATQMIGVLNKNLVVADMGWVAEFVVADMGWVAEFGVVDMGSVVQFEVADIH